MRFVPSQSNELLANKQHMDSQSKAKTAPVSKPSVVVPGRKPDPLGSVRRHLWFASLIVGTVLATGIVAALRFGQREFLAEATLEISPTFLRSSYGGSSAFGSDDQYRGYIQQQVAEISSYATARAALDKLGNERWYWQRGGESDRMAAERLAKTIDVNPVNGTYLISISLASGQPEGPAQIVNAVVKAYLERQRRQEIDESNQRVQLLTTHREDLRKETDSLRAQESELAQELRDVRNVDVAFTMERDWQGGWGLTVCGCRPASMAASGESG